MKLQLSSSLKYYILQFAEFYHRYKVDKDNLQRVRYRIHTSLADYQKTKRLELSITDRPGDLLPPLTIQEIKQKADILAGLHPIDVNSINDLYYLSHDQVKEIIVQDQIIQAIHHDDSIVTYDTSQTFDHQNSPSKRIAFMTGYMQAEKIMQTAYTFKERYRILQDNITTLQIQDIHTDKQLLMNPLDILFSDQYKSFSKEDIARIGYICGQMSQHHEVS